MPDNKYTGLIILMTLEEVLFVKELVPKNIIAQGNITVQFDSSSATTGGFVFKDSTGFTILRIDSSGNIHMRGDVLKDL